jgi:unsaturated rhamnogalacturonyl hydrolase
MREEGKTLFKFFSRMKRSILCILLTCIQVTLLNAQQLPSKSETLKKMILANDYFMAKWPDVGKTIITERERPSNIWTRGVYYEGLMALHRIFPQKEYYDYAVAWGEFHSWGMRNGNTTRNADDQCCGQTYIDLYRIDPKPERIRNIRLCMDMLVNTPQNEDWSWIDAIQMAMPVFARLGVLSCDERYFEKMHEMYRYTKTRHGDHGLYNPKDGFWWRDKDFDPPYTEPNGEDCYWSRGNGWVFAALARVLDVLPPDASHRNEYIQDFKTMAKALKEVQREDGFWNVSLHDPGHYGGKEATGTSLFVYGMAWGINHGILSAKNYLPVVIRGWNALSADCVHENGFLGYVQGTGKQPSDSQPVTYDSMPNFEDFGLGCFLLAGSEVYKLK